MKLMKTKGTGMLVIALTILSMSLWAQGNDGGKTGKKYVIDIIPAQSEVAVGETVQFQAVVHDRNGAPADAEVAWSVLNKRVGEIDEAGLFTAIGPGHTLMMARSEKAVGRAEVIVRGDAQVIPAQRRGLKVVIRPAGARMEVAETEQFTAALTDSAGNVLPAEFDWGVDGDFGSIDDTGLLEALEPGRGFVYASAGDISGRAHVVVMKDSNNGAGQGVRKTGTKMILVPKDTLVLVDNVVQFQAFLQDTLGNRTEVYPEWSLVGRSVGTIDESGLFTAESAGNGVIKALLERYTATARVRVASAEDTANANQIEFKMKKRDGDQVGNLKRIDESDVFKITGMPFPLNLLNGTEVTLPAGSLDENITINVSIPSLAELKADSTVSLPEAILNGVSFDVYVNGEKVSPYVFDEPVQLVIPYKQQLMEDLGLTLDDLWVFFYTDEAGFDSSGVFNVYVDTTDNKIIVEVTHFSEIVVGDKKLAGTTGMTASTLSPVRCALYDNYPNPFNPQTTIRFAVNGQGMQHLTLRVVNVLGEEVRMLADRAFAPGLYTIQWNGSDNRGQQMGSGVYLIRLEGLQINQTKRMLLLR
ncbi:hypothetical protein JW948_15930 [bacterium]|nr:hypothetical protein [bacterium]